MASAARAHVSSLRWRLAVWALFALGAGLVLHSLGAGFAWYLALALSTGFDAMLGRSFVETRSRADKATAGAMFVWGCAFSAMIFACMPLFLAWQGGGPGRVLGALMAASAFVRVMLFLSKAPGFMLVVGAPAVLCLLAMPFIPEGPDPARTVLAALGVGCGVAGFLAYVVRAAASINAMVEGHRTATAEAKARHLEAETRRAEAEEARRATTRFLNAVTHELRTPLNAVIGYSEIIAEDMVAEGRADTARDANRIEKSARHLLAVIDQILNMSSADAGHEGVSARDVDVRGLLSEAIAVAEQGARANNNRVSLHVSDEAARAHTDGGKLGVCVSALLSNAFKFTSNGLIAVRAEREGEALRIIVSDTGLGIAREDAERVFLPFVQVHAGRGGMGIGLAIARRMAQALGGRLDLNSEPGAGATFSLTIAQRLDAAAGKAAA